MPEGPIIVILKDAVKQFKGQKVTHASNNNHKLDPKMLIGQTVTDFKSWGKHFLICFPKFTIRVHMMMFGSYRINSNTNNAARLHLQFENGELNFYTVELLLIEKPLDDVYDWQADVMSKHWSANKAIEKMQEQPKLLACGNIIKNEVLFRTHIHPLSVVSAIPPKKLNEFINEAVNYSFDFLKWKKENTLSKHWEAYSQKVCPRNYVAFHIADTGKSHRKSYFCPLCQQLYSDTLKDIKANK